MIMNQGEIEWAASQRQGFQLLLKLMEAVNAQSDGWAYWSAPSKSAEKLQTLLKTAGNIHHGTHGKITAKELNAAITPIRAMVTRQNAKRAKFGNTFNFDVDAAL